MDDTSKTKEQLIRELGQLRERVAQLETSRAPLIEVESAMRESEARFRSLVQHSPDPIVVLEADGTVQYVSDASERMFGYTPEMMVGQSGFEFVHLDDLPGIRHAFAEVVGSPGAELSEVLRVSDSDGSWRTIEVTGSNRLTDPAIRGVVLNVRDITERRRVQEALRASLERITRAKQEWEATADALPQLICLLDSRGRVVRANRTVESWGLGSAADVREREIHDLLHPRCEGPACTLERAWSQEWAKISQGQPAECEVRDELLGRWLQCQARPISGQGGGDAREAGSFAVIAIEDITERKQTEQSLQDSEAKARALLNAPPDVVHLIDTDGTILDLNEETARKLGRKREELLGRSVYDFFPPSVAHRRKAQADEVVRTGKPVRFEDQRGDILYDSSLYPVFGAEGRVTQIAIVARDITEQRMAERALQESEEKLRRVVSQARDGISIVDERGVVIEWNRAMVEITGLERQDVVGKLVWDVQFQLVDEAQRTPETYARLESGLREFLQTGQAPWMDRTMEREYVHPDGSRLYVEGMVYAIQTHKGFMLVSVSRDITERKQAEKALRESQEQFAGFMDNLPGVAFIKDTAGRHLFVNREFEDLFGLSHDEWYGKTNEELFPGEIAEPFTRVDRLVLSTGVPVQAEERTETADWLSYKFPIGSSAPFDMLGGIAIDITERKLAEEALRESEERYRTLVENAPLCIHELGLDGRVLSMNAAGLSMVGAESDQEVIGRDYLSFVSPGDRERIVRLLQAALDGESSEFEYLAAGRHHPVFKSSFVPLKDVDGTVVKLMGITEDITERARAEEALRLNESRLQALVELGQMAETSLPQIADYVLVEAVKLTRSEIGFIGFMNADETVMNIHAWSEEAMAECAVADAPLHFPIDEAGIWGEAVRQRKPVIVNDYAAPNPNKRGYPDGHVSLARLLTVPVFERDRIVAVVAVGNKESEYDESDVRQLTLLTDGMWKLIQRRQIEEALRESEERFRSVYSQSPIAIELYDPEGYLVDANAACLDMFGVADVEAVKGFRLFEDPNVPKGAKQRLLAGEVVEYESEFDFELVKEMGLYETTKSGRCYLDCLITPWATGADTPGGFLVHVRDITERMQAEAALRESEANLSALIENTDGSIWSVDQDCRLIVGNSAFHRNARAMRGCPFTPGDSMLSSYSLPPEVLDEWRGDYDRALRGERFSVEIQERFADTSRYTEYRFNPIRAADESVTGVTVFGRDVTERRQMERTLEESEARHRAISELTSDYAYAFRVEPDGTVSREWMTKAFTRITGYDPDDMDPHDAWTDLVHPEDRPAFLRRTEMLMAGEPQVSEYRIRRKDGNTRWLRAYGRPVWNRDLTQVKRIYGAVQDITERKQAEEKLRESESKYRNLIETIPHGIEEVDLEGRTIFLNDSYHRILGYQPGVLVGKHIWDHAPNPEQVETRRKLFEFIKDEQPAPEPYISQNVRKDGTVIDVLVDWNYKRDENGALKGFISVVTDITERKQAEEALRRSLAETARGQRLLLALSQAAQAVQRARTPEAVYRAIGEKAITLGFDATVFTLSDDRTHLIVSHLTLKSGLIRAAEKLTGLSAKGYRFLPPPGGSFQRIIAGGETVISHLDATLFAEALPRPVRPLAGRLADLLGWQQSIIAPLAISGEIQGLLAFSGTDLTGSDVPAITAFANQAAIAIENARLYESLNQQQEELRALAARLAAVEEAERQRLVRELHDQVGQNLTALGINLNIVQAQSQGETTDLIRSRLADSLALVEQTTARIRSLMADLRPPVLDDYGLVAALRWLGEQTAPRAGIAVEVDGNELRPRLPDSAETALFRIAQEALTNVVKHAQATRATVTVKEDDDLVHMAIRDDGIGFDPARPPGAGEHWGLLTMRERAEAAGGSCRIVSQPGQGTQVIVEVQR